MKWNELPDGTEVVLQEDLMYLPEDAMEPGLVYSRNEIVAMLDVAYPAGTTFTFSLEDEVLYDSDGGICAQVPGLEVEMSDRFKVDSNPLLD